MVYISTETSHPATQMTTRSSLNFAHPQLNCLNLAFVLVSKTPKTFKVKGFKTSITSKVSHFNDLKSIKLQYPLNSTTHPQTRNTLNCIVQPQNNSNLNWGWVGSISIWSGNTPIHPPKWKVQFEPGKESNWTNSRLPLGPLHADFYKMFISIQD